MQQILNVKQTYQTSKNINQAHAQVCKAAAWLALASTSNKLTWHAIHNQEYSTST